MLNRRLTLALVFSAALFLLAAAARPAFAVDGSLYLVPKETTNRNSGYTALASGLDGKIYVGTAIYGGSGWLCALDPTTGQWKKVFTAHQFTRDTGTGLNSQSKFHAKIQVDSDGVVWLGTKQGNEDFEFRPEYGEDPTGYPGGHLFSYNPKTGEVIDHGILMKQEGLVGGAIDNQRRRVYFWSDPKQHFLIYDIARNTVTDKGATGGSPRYTPIDPRGRVFGTGRPGIIWMYDPATDKLSDLAVQLQGPGEYEDPYVLVISADGKSIYGCKIGGKNVLELDLTSIKLDGPHELTVPGTNGTIRAINRALVPHPGDEHAGTLGHDGCFYIADGQHVVKYDPKTHQAADLGVISIGGQPMAKAADPQGACVGPDGSIYFMYIYPLSVVKFDRLSAPPGVSVEGGKR